MGDNKYSPSFHKGIHAPLYDGFCPRIDGGGCFVQYHNRRIGHRCPGDGKELPLSLGQVGSVAGEKRVVAAGQTGDEIMGSCQLCRFNTILIGCVQPAVSDIFHNRSCEQVCILKNHTQRAAQIIFADFIDIDAVVADLAVGDIVKTVQQIGDGCLACTGCPYKGHLLAGLCIKGNIMQHRFIFLIAEIHVKQTYIPGLPCIGNRSVSLMGMFPCPQAGLLSTFHQPAVLLPYINQRYVALVSLRFLIQQIKDAPCAGKTHNYGIDLVGNLTDIAHKLFRHVQKRHCYTDAYRHAGQTHIRHFENKQRAAGDGCENVQNIADVVQNGTKDIGITVGFFRLFKKKIVDPVKSRLALFFMAEHLYHLLAVHHFLNVAFYPAQGLLLPEEIPGGAAAHFFRDKIHEHNANQNHQCQPQAVVDHDAENSKHRNRRDHQLGKALGNHLAQRIDIIGIMAHDIAVVVGIKIFDRKPLHFIKHLLPHFFQGSLGNNCHQLIVGNARQQRQHIKGGQNGSKFQDLRSHLIPGTILPVLLHQCNDILHENGRNGADYCVEYDADDGDRKHHRIKFPDRPEQTGDNSHTSFS